MPIQPGDHFLLYTDGVTEPENAHGDSFAEALCRHAQKDGESSEGSLGKTARATRED
jgi:serine phosphatase RsbU (regulator of sigma subunit)